ncbi:general substrate transporter [Hymenopellis radicata]|nr:general substrate transporter [Hymenopellis radicata]
MAGGAVANAGAGGFSHLIDPRRTWYNNKSLITSSNNGYDGSMMNGLQSVTQWAEYFDHPSGGKLGLLNAIQTIGSLGALPFSPYVSDGIGRRRTVALGAFLMIVATAIQTAAQSVGMFIGARFLIGFGLTFAANSAPLFVTEISYPTYRAPLTSCLSSLWYLGSIIAAWTTYGTFKINNTWSWRVALIWWAPESPRWLVSKGREEEALDVLAYYHADGNRDDPLVQFEIQEIKAAIDFDRNVAANVGWKALIKTVGNRKRMNIIIAIAFFSQWSGNGIASYYLNKILTAIDITDATTQLLINGVLQIWNLAWALLASFLVDRAGRRPLFLLSGVGMFIFFSAQTVCFGVFSEKGTPGAAHGLLAFIFLFYAAYDIAFLPLTVTYTVEIMPYPLRAKGLTVFTFTVVLALIFNQYVNPVALDNIGWKYYVCNSPYSKFLGTLVVETKNLSLEETAALFDGPDAARELQANAHTEARLSPKEKVSEKHSLDDIVSPLPKS